MSSGLACVASRLPGSTDVIIEDGVNGMLVPPDDTTAFTRALELLLTDRPAALRLAAAARASIVSRYSIERTAPMWLAAYREASGDGAATSKP
jgi:mannosyltransferase